MDGPLSIIDLTLTLAAGVPTAVAADPPAIMRFMGRLHPVMVHFPIALILAAAFFEVLRSMRRRSGERRGSAAGPCLVLGALGACVAAYFGWLNADFEPQTQSLERTLFLHRWIGVATASVAVLAVLVSFGRRVQWMENSYRGALALAVALVCAGGYFGGELTYPENYLFAVFQSPDDADTPSNVGAGGGGKVAVVPVMRDLSREEQAYVDVIQPILEERCYECHGPAKQKGHLRLDRRAVVFEAEIIEPGDAAQSELYQRISLDPDDLDIMPAKGDALTAEQIESIRMWIDAGAKWPEAIIAAVPTAVAEPASKDDPSSAVELPVASRARLDRALEALRTRGAVALPIAADTDAIDVNLSLMDPPATDADLALLADLAPLLTWLNLARSSVTDAGLAHLAGMASLQRLRLENTQIGDAGLEHVARLEKLEYLNVYGTGVTDAGLSHLEGLPELRQLFLWQTAVTEDGVAALRAARPELTVVLGTELALATEPEEDTEVEQKLPNCCAKAKEAGGECDHQCCIEARADGKICEKCAAG